MQCSNQHRYSMTSSVTASSVGGTSMRVAKRRPQFSREDVNRHLSVDTFRGYVHDAEIFKDHAGSGLL
jgi:hypothetical protein